MLAEQVGIFIGALTGTLVEIIRLDTQVEVMVLMVLSFLLLITLVGFTEHGSRLWSLLPNFEYSPEKGNDLDWVVERYNLTKREGEMLSLFVEGRSMPYIAEMLTISENTVKTHIRNIYTKMGIHNKQELLDIIGGYSE